MASNGWMVKERTVPSGTFLEILWLLRSDTGIHRNLRFNAIVIVMGRDSLTSLIFTDVKILYLLPKHRLIFSVSSVAVHSVWLHPRLQFVPFT